MKNSFILYHSYKRHLELLTNEQRGVLFTAIFDYSESGVVPELEPVVKMAFNFIAEDIDINKQKWEDTVEARSEAGRKGAEARWKKAPSRKKKMAKDGKRILPMAKDGKNAVSVSVSVSDSVNDSVSDSENNISNDIGKTPAPTKGVDSSKKEAYGNSDINTCISYLQEKLGSSLDGSVKENRQYCHNLLRKMKKDFPNTNEVEQVKLLIDVALQDKFHSRNTTGFKYLFYNTQRIAQSFKGDFGVGERYSDIQVI